MRRFLGARALCDHANAQARSRSLVHARSHSLTLHGTSSQNDLFHVRAPSIPKEDTKTKRHGKLKLTSSATRPHPPSAVRPRSLYTCHQMSLVPSRLKACPTPADCIAALGRLGKSGGGQRGVGRGGDVRGVVACVAVGVAGVARRGMAWRGVAWRGVAWRGVAG